MASLNPRRVVAVGGWGWDWPQHSYLSPANLGLGLSLATVLTFEIHNVGTAHVGTVPMYKMQDYIFLKSV